MTKNTTRIANSKFNMLASQDGTDSVWLESSGDASETVRQTLNRQKIGVGAFAVLERRGQRAKSQSGV